MYDYIALAGNPSITNDKNDMLKNEKNTYYICIIHCNEL